MDSDWAKKLETRLQAWRTAYPELLFKDPGTLRLQLRTLGYLSENSRVAIGRQLQGLPEFKATEGGIHLSPDQRGLELWYRVPKEDADRISRASDIWVSVGALPDRERAASRSTRKWDWIRIPVAALNPMREGGEEVLSRFLYEEHLGGELEGLPVRGVKLSE